MACVLMMVVDAVWSLPSSARPCVSIMSYTIKEVWANRFNARLTLGPRSQWQPGSYLCLHFALPLGIPPPPSSPPPPDPTSRQLGVDAEHEAMGISSVSHGPAVAVASAAMEYERINGKPSTLACGD